MRFEDFLAESYAKKFHDTHMAEYLKHSKAAEVAHYNAKRYPNQANEYHAKAKDHETQAENHRKEMEHWAREHRNTGGEE